MIRLKSFSVLILLKLLFIDPVDLAPVQKQLHPVILVPGFGGSQFEAKLHKPGRVHDCCKKDADWFPFWFTLEESYFAPDCLIDNMRLQYDSSSRQTYNQPGVELRQPGFGDTYSVEWLDATHRFFKSDLSYFFQIVEALVNTLDYTRGVDIRGAPYDFRKAPNELQLQSSFFSNLTGLVEETYYKNNNRRVILLGHSMGCLNLLYFLNNQQQVWKDKFIRSFMTLGGPWGGSVKALRVLASGDDLGHPYIFSPYQIRPLQRSMPSAAFLMPYDTFWNESEILVYGPAANYTVNDYQKFTNDIGFPNGFLMRQDTEQLVKALEHPGVEIFCLYGYGLATPDAFLYTQKSDNWMDYKPGVISGDGDGTVNTRSLTACKRWANSNWKLHLKEFYNTEHLGMLSSLDVINYLIQQLSQD